MRHIFCYCGIFAGLHFTRALDEIDKGELSLEKVIVKTHAVRGVIGLAMSQEFELKRKNLSKVVIW